MNLRGSRLHTGRRGPYQTFTQTSIPARHQHVWHCYGERVWTLTLAFGCSLLVLDSCSYLAALFERSPAPLTRFLLHSVSQLVEGGFRTLLLGYGCLSVAPALSPGPGCLSCEVLQVCDGVTISGETKAVLKQLLVVLQTNIFLFFF